MLHYPPDPWQDLALIHGGELLPDGRPRFRIFILIVARQNGKTTICVVLSGYWQTVEAVPLILGTSTKLDYAKESWHNAVKLIQAAARRDDADGRDLARLIPRDRYGAPKWTRRTNGEQESWVYRDADNPDADDVSRYKIGTADESGGRSLTINKLICDELRQHDSWSAWDAAEPATSAVWDSQIWGLSNAGSAKSVVLNQLRRDALHFIETGEGDYRIGIAEWSADDDIAERLIAGQDVTDAELMHALRQANPNLGRRKDPEALFMAARRAIAAGGDALNGFLTEQMCVNVQRDNPAIDSAGWRGGNVPGTLEALRGKVALVLDIAPDERHATLMAAAAVDDIRVRVEPVSAWDDPNEAIRDLPAIVARIRPRAFGWLPEGPAAAYAAKLRPSKTGRSWVPPGVVLQEIRAEVPDVCMGFAALVKARHLLHSGDPLLDAQVGVAERRKMGDRWVFARPRETEIHVDAVYAAAGAAHLARTLPPAPSMSMPTPLGG